MLNEEQQHMLTRVGPGTPMGDLLRRYWFPVAAQSELATGAAMRVRLLGEDLVLFRPADSEPGLIDARCPHRGVSLGYGCVDGNGLRCPYHGWQFDVAGACIDIPGEPRAEIIRERVSVTSYRTQTLGGLIFAYLGPEPAPLLPRYDLFVRDGMLRDIGHATIPCNWLQIMENSVDPIHVEWLHGNYPGPVDRDTGTEPYRRRHLRIGFDRFEHGIIKRRILEGGSEADDDWRVGHPLVFPSMLKVGCHGHYSFQIRVPVDDTTTRHLWYSCFQPPDGTSVPDCETIPFYEVPWRDASGGFRMDFIDGQDIMAWVTQGPVADRRNEQLVSSDRGIALLRNILFEQIEQVRKGNDPMAVIRNPSHNVCISLPQEENKYGDTAAFRSAAIRHSHIRFSPQRERIFSMFNIDTS